MPYMNAVHDPDGPMRLEPNTHHTHGALWGIAGGAAIGWYIFRGSAGYDIRTPRLWWPWFASLLVAAVMLGYPMWWPTSVPLLLMYWAAPFVWSFLAIIHMRLDVGRQMMAQAPQLQRAAYQQQVYAEQVIQNAHEAERQATAKATGDAVVDAMRRAYQETRQEPAPARQERRNVIDVPALPPGPQSPTGPAQATPPPSPGPMGSGSPTLWVPTYRGPVQRRETTLGGTSISDRRRIDPDTL